MKANRPLIPCHKNLMINDDFLFPSEIIYKVFNCVSKLVSSPHDDTARSHYPSVVQEWYSP